MSNASAVCCLGGLHTTRRSGSGEQTFRRGCGARRRTSPADYELHRRLFGASPREDWLPLESELRAEVDERLARLGYDTLDAWAGVENLKERVDGEDAIDPVVLDALREAS